MEKSLTFADNDSFYNQLLELESRNEIYSIYYVPKSKTILSANALSHVQ